MNKTIFPYNYWESTKCYSMKAYKGQNEGKRKWMYSALTTFIHNCVYTIVTNNLISLLSSPFPKRQILDSSKLKQSADDNFKFDENGRKFFKRIEKEKLPVTSNVSFSHSVFYLFRKLLAIFLKLWIVVCKFFQFGRIWNLLFGKGLIKLGIETESPRSPEYMNTCPVTLGLLIEKKRVQRVIELYYHSSIH